MTKPYLHTFKPNESITSYTARAVAMGLLRLCDTCNVSRPYAQLKCTTCPKSTSIIIKPDPEPLSSQEEPPAPDPTQSELQSANSPYIVSKPATEDPSSPEPVHDPELLTKIENTITKAKQPDTLETHTKRSLVAIAQAEGIRLPRQITKPRIITRIRAKRAADK